MCATQSVVGSCFEEVCAGGILSVGTSRRETVPGRGPHSLQEQITNLK